MKRLLFVLIVAITFCRMITAQEMQETPEVQEEQTSQTEKPSLAKRFVKANAIWFGSTMVGLSTCAAGAICRWVLSAKARAYERLNALERRMDAKENIYEARSSRSVRECNAVVEKNRALFMRYLNPLLSKPEFDRAKWTAENKRIATAGAQAVKNDTYESLRDLLLSYQQPSLKLGQRMAVAKEVENTVARLENESENIMRTSDAYGRKFKIFKAMAQDHENEAKSFNEARNCLHEYMRVKHKAAHLAHRRAQYFIYAGLGLAGVMLSYGALKGFCAFIKWSWRKIRAESEQKITNPEYIAVDEEPQTDSSAQIDAVAVEPQPALLNTETVPTIYI